MPTLKLRFSDRTTVDLPDGHFDVEEQALQGDRIGAVLRGQCGRSLAASPTHGSNGAGTILNWTGPDTGPMFLMGGSYHTLSDLTIVGVTDRLGTNAGLGTAIQMPNQTGSGTGKHRYERLFFDDCDRCIVAGQNISDFGCDHCRIVDNHARGCSRFFVSNNEQSQNHIFENIQWFEGRVPTDYDMSIILDCNGGGMFRARHVDMRHNGLVLRVANTGRNVDLFEVEGVDIDTQAAGNFRLCEALGWNNDIFFGRIKLPIDVHQALRDTGEFINSSGGNRIVIRDSATISRGFYKGAVQNQGGSDRVPWFIIEKCQLDMTSMTDASEVVLPGSKCILTVKDCWDEWATPVTDIDRMVF